MLKRGNILATADIGITVFEPRLIKNDHFLQFLTTKLVAGKVLIKPLNSLTLDPDIKSELGVSYTDKNFQFKQSELVSSRKMANFDKKTPFWADFKGNYLIWDVFKSKIYCFSIEIDRK